MRSERFDQAVASFQHALELNPRLNLAHYGMGRAYMALRRYTEAVRAYTECRQNFVVEAGRAFVNQTDANRARQDRLMELRDLQVQYSRGPQTQQTADAQRQIQNAIRLTQDADTRGVNANIDASVPAFLLVALGSAYFRSEHFEDAERAYRDAIKADPKAGEAHNNLAVILMMKAQYTDAMAELKAAEKAGFRVNPELKDQIKSRMAQ